MNKLNLALASILAAGSALAGPAPAPMPAPPATSPLLNYNNLELGWVHTEWDSGFLNSSDGAAGSISWSPMQHFYLTAGGAWETVDTTFDTTDLWTANVGVGGYFPLAQNIDFVAEVGALFYGIDNGLAGSEDDASAYARPHIRARWGRFETHVGATWANINVTNEWNGFGRFYFELFENFDLVGGISAGSEAYTVNAGIRLRY